MELTIFNPEKIFDKKKKNEEKHAVGDEIRINEKWLQMPDDF